MSCHRMNTKKPALGDNLTYERSGDKDKVLTWLDITSIVNFYEDKMFCPSKLIYFLYCISLKVAVQRRLTLECSNLHRHLGGETSLWHRHRRAHAERKSIYNWAISSMDKAYYSRPERVPFKIRGYIVGKKRVVDNTVKQLFEIFSNLNISANSK
jgi:hypothetical protein